MAEAIVLNANLREKTGTGAARQARESGMLPGVVYGNNKEAVSIAMDPRPIMKEMQSVEFYSKIFDLNIDGKKEKVFAKEVQKHVINGLPIHIDFLRVDAKNKMHVMIPLNFVNENNSPALKRGAVLNVVHHEINVIALAANMPSSIEVDLSGLEVGDAITIADIKLPSGVEIFQADPSETVATVVAPSSMKSKGDTAGDSDETAAESDDSTADSAKAE